MYGIETRSSFRQADSHFKSLLTTLGTVDDDIAAEKSTHDWEDAGLMEITDHQIRLGLIREKARALREELRALGKDAGENYSGSSVLKPT